MENDFCEAKKRKNKVMDEKSKNQAQNPRAPSNNQNKNHVVQQSGEALANVQSTKVFGKNYIEAPVPTRNPWTMRSNEVFKAEPEFPSTSKNTNAAETTASGAMPSARTDTDTEGPRKTDASPTKARTCSRSSEQQTSRIAASQHSHQASNPPIKTSQKKKAESEEKQHGADLSDAQNWPTLDQKESSTPDKTTAVECTSTKQIDSIKKAGESSEDDLELQSRGAKVNSNNAVNNNQAIVKKNNKQKWVPLQLDSPRPERRRGVSRGRGISRPQKHYHEDNDRQNRNIYRRPNRTGEVLRQSETETRGERDRPFRPRRGQSRGRGYHLRDHREEHVIQNEEVDRPPFAVPEYFPEEPAVAQVESRDAKILQQIEYYFSDVNLEKDFYLRRHMDPDGWVEIKFILKFPRLQKLTDKSEDIAKAMKLSSQVELSSDGEKLRTSDNPAKWPLSAMHSKLKPDAPEFVPGQLYVVKSADDSATSSSSIDPQVSHSAQ